MNNLKYSKDHLWLRQDGNLIRLGISDYAQASLGVILFLNLPAEGDTLEIGKPFGDIESVKTVADPYGSWFVEVRAEELAEDLMDEAAYQRYQEAL